MLMTAALALFMAGGAIAADLKFKPGEDSKFNWQSFEDFKKGHDLKGQTLTIFGPWRGEDEALFKNVYAYFVKATGVELEGAVRPLPGVSVAFGGTYLDASYEDFFTDGGATDST